MIGHTTGLVRTPDRHQNSLKTKVGVPVFPLGFPGLAVRLDDSFAVYENTNTVFTNRVDTTDETDGEIVRSQVCDDRKETYRVEASTTSTKRHIIYEGKIILYSKTPPYIETYKMYQGLTPGISKIPVTHQPIRRINFDEITNLSSTTTTTESRSDEFYDKNTELCTDVKNNCCYYILCCGLCCE